MTIKILRKTGNSIGVTLSKDDLEKSQFNVGDELLIEARPGEVKITRNTPTVLLELTHAEAAALANEDMESRHWSSASAKAKRLVKHLPATSRKNSVARKSGK